MDDLIQRLLKEKLIEDIKPPRYKRDQIPGLDVSLIKEDKIEEATHYYDTLKNFLCDTYTIVYKITDQGERHRYEAYLIKTYGTEAERLLEKSLLPVGLLETIPSYINWLSEDLKEPNERIKDIFDEVSAEWEKDYQHTSNERKIEFAELLQDRVYEVLNIVSVNSPAS